MCDVERDLVKAVFDLAVTPYQTTLKMLLRFTPALSFISPF
jgi:hypothetical protein